MAGFQALLHGDPRFGLAGWWRFETPVAELQARDLAGVPGVLDEVESATRSEGLWAVGFVAYEASPAFEAKAAVRWGDGGEPLAWFGLFAAPRPSSGPRSVGDLALPKLSATITRTEYRHAVEVIRAAIARGDTYQANFTYRLRGVFRGEAERWFAHLVDAQRSPYSLLLEHEEWAVASVSPELFFERLGPRIACRPMKGTAARGRTLLEDQELASALVSSAKERAENLMIVDMIRNDLGRLAAPGTVRVPRLFSIERYETVTQMTSDVEAQIDAPLPAVFRALFPCASITGAPKLSTMALLADLETTPRGVYTGVLGFVAPGGDARFSVGIRTSWLDRSAGTIEYGTGSGIVWDSRPAAEWTESRLKRRVLGRAEPPFELLETLRWSPRRGFVRLDEHLQRMQASAVYFLRPFDSQEAREALRRSTVELEAVSQRVRLLLDREGSFRVTHEPLEPQALPWTLSLAREPVDASDRFLFHKTTFRQAYDRTRRETPAGDEVLLWNAAGEITEGTRTNVALEIESQWWTPPIRCGLLGGVARAALVRTGRLRERVLGKDDLARASRIALMNSLRGWIPARMTE